jgi:regulator of extracellular matrix RemA (YlzA/DUF370 family)
MAIAQTQLLVQVGTIKASPSSAVLKRLILSLLKSYTDVGATFERISVAVIATDLPNSIDLTIPCSIPLTVVSLSM